MPEAKLERFKAEYGLNEKLARQVISSDYTGLFEELVGDGRADPTLLAVTLTETFKSLEREGVKVEALGDDAISQVFELIRARRTAKESLPQIFTWLAENPDNSSGEALRSLGLEMLTLDELRGIVESRVSENMEMVDRMGMRAFGLLMRMLMGEVRGRARAKDVQSLLREALSPFTKD